MIKIFKTYYSNILITLAFVIFSNIITAQTDKGTLIFSHEHGFFTDPFSLIISSNINNSIISYTLDGSNPYSSNSRIISNSPSSIIIDPKNTLNRDFAPCVVVRACVINNDTLVGKIITQTFLFPNEIISLSRDNMLPGSGWLAPGSGHDINYGLDPEIYYDPEYENLIDDAFISIPTFSLVTDLKNLFDPEFGIYVNALFHGKSWEREASLELLNPNGSDGFQIDCGVRIRGGWSRHYNNPKHAFRFIFREEYGEGKLNFPLFGDEGVDEFDNIDLRTSQNYSWAYGGDSRNTFIREVFSRDTQRDMGQPYTRSRYYHLYINGTYWGLYQSQERSEASFAESYFGGKKEDYDVIKVDVGDDFNLYNIEATDGILDKWRELWSESKNGFTDDESYYRIQGKNVDGSDNPIFEKLLDVDNLIDYMIITFFVGDFDGPISNFRNNEFPNNFYAIYNRVNPDGFKFFRHDGEHTLLDHPWGFDRTGPFPAGNFFEKSNPQFIHQELSKNKKYQLRFADRVYKHFFNNGALTYTKNVYRILSRKVEIESAIIAESARWGDSKSSVPFTKTDWINAIDFLIDDYLPSRNVNVLNQLLNKNLYSTAPIPIFNMNGGIVEKGTEIELSSSSGSIYYTLDGADPFLPSVNNQTTFEKMVIEQSSAKKIFVPTSPQLDSWYGDINFNDDSWISVTGSGGIGYDTKGIYTPHIFYNTKNMMHESGNNPNTSCFIRINFNLTESDLLKSNRLILDMFYDDGFTAYLNGTQILSMNSPDELFWNSTSLTYLDSDGFERFNLSQYHSVLKGGKNLLAIHGLNTSLQCSDFIILPTLMLTSDDHSGPSSSNAILYDSPITIEETVIIKARAENNGVWGILNEKKFMIDELLDDLKITELHYHPLDQIDNQDTISGKSFEFIELKNIGNVELNLSYSSFIDGINYIFPPGYSIESGEFIVLASDSIRFKSRYGISPNDQFNGNLNNGGEQITFQNSAGRKIIDFKYNDKFPWPEEADGSGYSLVSFKRNPTSKPDLANYWNVSNDINGSPYSDDIVSDINENENSIIDRFVLSQNYPNPFNPSTIIRYQIPSTVNTVNLSRRQKVLVETNASRHAPEVYNVQLIVYDILGREVATLVNENKRPGSYEVIWNPSADGITNASGLYFYKLSTGEYNEVKKMILLK